MELPLDTRVRALNERPVHGGGRFVLYWMVGCRRATSSFPLDRAIAWSEALQRPLVVLEALRVDYPWASDRHHRFVLDGMRDNALAFRESPAFYYPYVEPAPGAGKGLLEELARQACVVITDDTPGFFLPRMVSAAASRVGVRLEAVDGNGLLPLRLATRAYPAAVHFRRHVQRHLREALRVVPAAAPFANRALPRAPELPPGVIARWPPAPTRLLDAETDGGMEALRGLPIDHGVAVAATAGGSRAAATALAGFIDRRLDLYHDAHRHPDDDGTSRLSPYLHFGHLAPHAVFAAVARHERWSLGRLASRATGSRTGWWGVGPGAEAFLDQLVVWRELAFNTCVFVADFDQYHSLPRWALDTLDRHRRDRRPYLYSLEQFEEARTHDPLWNAAQRQLREEGWMHNYLRMLWGKKILEWTRDGEEALRVMRAVMDRWALDGRDANSHAGYFWTLGRYDRPWPERPVFGTVRSMSSDSARRKVRVSALLNRYGPTAAREPEQRRLPGADA